MTNREDQTGQYAVVNDLKIYYEIHGSGVAGPRAYAGY